MLLLPLCIRLLLRCCAEVLIILGVSYLNVAGVVVTVKCLLIVRVVVIFVLLGDFVEGRATK